MTTKADNTAELVTDLMLSVFRVNGRLLACGDVLVEPLGLTSARWQVLGAVALAGKALSAPQIAEAMGITRQGALKQLSRLVEEGLLEQQPNPRHERSPLYQLTAAGRKVYDRAAALNGQWTERLAGHFDRARLKAALAALQVLAEQLEPSMPAARQKRQTED